MHALGTHFDGGGFRRPILALEAKRAPAVDIVKN